MPARRSNKSGDFPQKEMEMTMNEVRKPFPRRWLLLILVALVVAAVVYVDINYLGAGGLVVRRDESCLDLRDKDLTVESYKELAQTLPDCKILWNIPAGGETYPSDAQELILSRADGALLSALPLFPELRTIDATAIASAGEVQRLLDAAPQQCQVLWAVHLDGKQYDPGLEELKLDGTNVTCQELRDNLSRFEKLTQVSLLETSLTTEEKLSLKEQFPDIPFCWEVQAAGETWKSTDEMLSYAGKEVDAKALADAGKEFYQVAEIDLSGCGLSLEELTAVQAAYPGTFLRSELRLYGQEFTTDAEFLDFSQVPMKSTEQVAALAALMPKLRKVDMCDCGISNEEMDALNKSFKNIQFVWRVKFSVYSLRTDATYFCASDLPWNGYVAIKMNDKQLEPIKYCTELIALDLGHMYYTDLSFLENMPKLQYLILVDAKFHDITPIGTLQELKYLEIFVNTIDDLSPLLQCKNLRHLNIGYTTGFDPTVLKQMPYLERLWFPGHRQDKALIDEIIAALPDTQCHMPQGDPDGSTGRGWREAEIYYEMRNIFGMHYMPGGTGMDPK